MRVIRFSIGWGPALLTYQSKKTGNIYQVAAIPFFAFVQIAGMNPFEEIDPDDKSSYANGSLFARIFAILAATKPEMDTRCDGAICSVPAILLI